MITSYEHPTTSYVEVGTGSASWLWCFLFGPLYFLVKGNYKHMFLSFIASIATFGISWFVYPFFLRGINDTFYRQRGWRRM